MYYIAASQCESIEAVQYLVLAVPIPGHGSGAGEIAFYLLWLDIGDSDIAHRFAEGLQSGCFRAKT